ncbi:MAG: GntR family transcriptional regulator [Actinobacteria bacterium]|nr:GntR family transcriptional regulator [Actinomycetota bacterium]MBU1493581.1 GntR family transcriptional regulator [Actinomycetota bacterium]
MTSSLGSRGLFGEIPLSERTRTAYEFVLGRLRSAIVSGQIAGGTHLVQATVASELGVSTTPVREALRQLASEGIVELDPHRGAVVKSVNLDEMLEIYDLRALLEPRCMEMAAQQISEEALERAGGLHRQMESEHDLVAWAHLNREFHQVLCNSVDSSRLVSILQSLHAANALYVSIGLRILSHPLEAGNRDHRELLAALRKGDPAAAASVSRAHIQATIDLTMAAQQPESIEGRAEREDDEPMADVASGDLSLH